jgi:hypothetical protein
MRDAASLERAYRRLLAWYPARYRQDNQDEMLGVLLASARAGQCRPSLAEACDLIWGALRIRLRPSRPGSADPAWRDAMAVFSFTAPLILLLAAVIGTLVSSAFWSLADGPGVELVALAAAVLLRHRRVALAMVAISIAYSYFLSNIMTFDPRMFFLPSFTGFHGLYFYVSSPGQLYSLSFYALEAVALLTSAGPRRGLQILTRKRGILLAVAAIAISAFWNWQDIAADLAAVVVLAVIAVVLAKSSRLDRNLVVLFTIVFYPRAMELATPQGRLFPDWLPPVSPGWIALLYVPPVLIALLAIRAAGRGQPVPPAGPDATA